MPEDDNTRALRILFDAKRRATEVMPENAFITALIDFTATMALLAEGEAGLLAATERMKRLMVHAKNHPFSDIPAAGN
jgi:hypothetical protein